MYSRQDSLQLERIAPQHALAPILINSDYSVCSLTCFFAFCSRELLRYQPLSPISPPTACQHLQRKLFQAGTGAPEVHAGRRAGMHRKLSACNSEMWQQ